LNGAVVANGPPGEEGKQSVIRWMPEDGALAPLIDFQAIGGHTAPIGEIPAGEGRRDFIFRRPDSAGKMGTAAIGSHRDGGAFRRPRAARAITAANAGHAILHEALFVPACRMIRLQCGDPGLSSERIARALSISTRLLQRIFAERNESPMAHVWEERIDRAARLLADPRATHRSVTEIAFACGFNDTTHFGRVFAARMAMTPTQWRRRAR
jgi:AraC-like DNA-binding protein